MKPNHAVFLIQRCTCYNGDNIFHWVLPPEGTRKRELVRNMCTQVRIYGFIQAKIWRTCKISVKFDKKINDHSFAFFKIHKYSTIIICSQHTRLTLVLTMLLKLSTFLDINDTNVLLFIFTECVKISR